MRTEAEGKNGLLWKRHVVTSGPVPGKPQLINQSSLIEQVYKQLYSNIAQMIA